MSTGERIKQARKRSGLSQKELAKRLSVTPALISNIERGDRNPKIETIRKIAIALDTSFSLLIEPTPVDWLPFAGEMPDNRSNIPEYADAEKRLKDYTRTMYADNFISFVDNLECIDHHDIAQLLEAIVRTKYTVTRKPAENGTPSK